MTFGSEFRATCQSRSANALVSGIAACPPAAAPVSRSRIKRLLSWAGENLGRFRRSLQTTHPPPHQPPRVANERAHGPRPAMQSDRLLVVEPLLEPVGKPLERIHGDVVKAEQFVHDHRLDELAEAQRLPGGRRIALPVRRVAPWVRRVVLWMIRLVDGVAAKEDVDFGRLADAVLVSDGVVAAAHEGALEARAGNAVEPDIEPVLQQHRVNRPLLIHACRRLSLARSPPLASAHTGGGSRQSVWSVLIHTSLGGPAAAGSLGSAVRRAGACSPQSVCMGCPASLCLNMPQVARLRMVEGGPLLARSRRERFAQCRRWASKRCARSCESRARLSSESATSGWSGPNAFSLIANDRLNSVSALSYRCRSS